MEAELFTCSDLKLENFAFIRICLFKNTLFTAMKLTKSDNKLILLYYTEISGFLIQSISISIKLLNVYKFSSPEDKRVFAPGGRDCLAHARQKSGYIVGLTALQLAFFMGYE